MEDERLSHEQVSTLFYIVVCLFPVLCILEIVIYCAYQFKVKFTHSSRLLSVKCYFIYKTLILYQFHPWADIIKDDDNKTGENSEETAVGAQTQKVMPTNNYETLEINLKFHEEIRNSDQDDGGNATSVI